MKKVILVWVFVSLLNIFGTIELLYADDNKIQSISIKEQKTVILNDYAEALNFYKKKEYNKSYTILNRLFEQNLNDTNVDFYLGRSAFEIGNYHEALLAFNRILFHKPDTLRVQFEQGRVYIAQQNYLAAKQYFSSILENSIAPNELKIESEKYLVLIDKMIIKYQFGGAFIFGINYDSNINQRARYDYFDIPLVGTIPNTTKKEGASAHQEVLVGNYSYKLDDTMILKTDGVAFGKFMFHNDLDDKNIKMLSLTESLAHKYQENLLFEYGVFIDNLWMGASNYMRSYGLIPKVNYIKDEKNSFDAQLKYQVKKYQQAVNKPNDSKYVEFGAKYSYIYSDFMTFTPNIIFANDRADDSASSGVSNHSFQIGLDTNLIYSPKILFTPSLNYKITNYDVRDEKQIFVKFGSTYIYSPVWMLQGDVSYTNQTSNDKPFEYPKYNFGINIIRAF